MSKVFPETRSLDFELGQTAWLGSSRDSVFVFVAGGRTPAPEDVCGREIPRKTLACLAEEHSWGREEHDGSHGSPRKGSNWIQQEAPAPDEENPFDQSK